MAVAVWVWRRERAGFTRMSSSWLDGADVQRKRDKSRNQPKPTDSAASSRDSEKQRFTQPARCSKQNKWQKMTHLHSYKKNQEEGKQSASSQPQLTLLNKQNMTPEIKYLAWKLLIVGKISTITPSQSDGRLVYPVRGGFHTRASDPPAAASFPVWGKEIKKSKKKSHN